MMNYTFSRNLPLFLLSFSPFLQAETIESTESTLSPITVTATRTAQDTKLVSSTVIKRADIERLQANSVEEVLRGIAGINMSSTGGVGKQTSVSLRGTNSTHIIVLVDGVRVGSVSAGLTAFENLPINEIDNIEVIRGAKSSLYGSEAIGGVIHIHTRPGAQKAFKPVLSLSAGSHNRYRYSGGVSGKVDNSWYNVNFTHEQTQGFDATRNGLTPDNDGYSNHSGSVRLGHQFSERLLVEGNFLYAAGHNEYDSFGDEFAKNSFVQQVVGGQIKYKAADFWNMTFKAGESLDINNDKSSYPFRYESHRFSLTAQNDFTLAKGNIFSVGYDYLADELKSSTAFTQSKRDDHAVFTQYQGEYDNHSVLAGFRHDENQQFGGYNTWNVGYGYTFLNDFTFSASYGTAFKAPTFNDLYYPSSPYYAGGNPTLRPETSRNYEVSLKGKHDWGRWEINHYSNYIQNLIVANPAKNFLTENIGKAEIRGVELIGETQLYGFNIRGNLSLLHPEDKATGKLLARRAEEVFRLDVDKRLDDFSVGATVIAEGRRFDDKANTQRVAGFTTLDLRAEYTLLKQLTLQAKVNNILNKQYQTVKAYNTDDLNFFFTLRYTPDI